MNIDNVIKNLNTQNDTHIVIGVSAGPDSMALLHSAITNLNKTIICAHINHNVRTESNEEEKYFVAQEFQGLFQCQKVLKLLKK
mgnify:CR=1 FL=1